jgi:16S rRNA (adenine1518-N6/adenine1519-N6)-dimethyltransferase
MPQPRKRFAQHWLQDVSVHTAIVAAAELPSPPPPDLTILEIGPGRGQLTEHLLQTGAQVIAVELDRDLCQHLHQTLGSHPRFQLIEADFLRMRIPAQATLLVANIPYNITSPILSKVLGSPEQPVTQFQRIVLLLQREVAERLQAQPGSKTYGAMSVRIQYLADCELIQIVPPQAFYPKPKVDSAVIRLHPRPWPLQAEDPRWFSTLVQQGFATRRKKLVNCLQSLVDKPNVLEVLTHLHLDPNCRAEQLGLNDWIHLSNHLLGHRLSPAPEPSADLTPAALPEGAGRETRQKEHSPP